jgi:hypothetical protein
MSHRFQRLIVFRWARPWVWRRRIFSDVSEHHRKISGFIPGAIRAVRPARV